MKHGILALLAGMVGCVTEEVSIRLDLDSSQCAAQTEIAQIEVLALELHENTYCTIALGSSTGSSGTLTLSRLDGDYQEVVVLALAYGTQRCPDGDCKDTGPPIPVDGPPADLPPQPFCGDFDCGANESCHSCPQDCGQCPPTCGDNSCDPSMGESCQSCPQDCGQCPVSDFGQPPSKCGDQYCDYGAGEDCQSCPKDCGQCPGTDFGQPPSKCGDGFCDQSAGESCQSCPKDCCNLPDAGPPLPPGLDGGMGFGLAPCVRCFGITRLILGGQAVQRTIVLVPTSSCQVPEAAPEQLGLPGGKLPPSIACP